MLIQRSLIHVRFTFPGLWPLLMTVSGLEETICTGHLKLKFFLYYFQMVFHTMFVYLRGKGLILLLKKLNFLGLAQIKSFVFFKNGTKIHLIIITYLSYSRSYRKRLIFHPHYNTWNIWWHFLSYDAHLWCWSKFLHHSDCFPRICLLTLSLFFPSHSGLSTVITASLTNAEEKPNYQLHCYR